MTAFDVWAESWFKTYMSWLDAARPAVIFGAQRFDFYRAVVSSAISHLFSCLKVLAYLFVKVGFNTLQADFVAVVATTYLVFATVAHAFKEYYFSHKISSDYSQAKDLYLAAVTLRHNKDAAELKRNVDVIASLQKTGWFTALMKGFLVRFVLINYIPLYALYFLLIAIFTRSFRKFFRVPGYVWGTATFGRRGVGLESSFVPQTSQLAAEQSGVPPPAFSSKVQNMLHRKSKASVSSPKAATVSVSSSKAATVSPFATAAATVSPFAAASAPPVSPMAASPAAVASTAAHIAPPPVVMGSALVSSFWDEAGVFDPDQPSSSRQLDVEMKRATFFLPTSESLTASKKFLLGKKKIVAPEAKKPKVRASEPYGAPDDGLDNPRYGALRDYAYYADLFTTYFDEQQLEYYDDDTIDDIALRGAEAAAHDPKHAKEVEEFKKTREFVSGRFRSETAFKKFSTKALSVDQETGDFVLAWYDGDAARSFEEEDKLAYRDWHSYYDDASDDEYYVCKTRSRTFEAFYIENATAAQRKLVSSANRLLREIATGPSEERERRIQSLVALLRKAPTSESLLGTGVSTPPPATKVAPPVVTKKPAKAEAFVNADGSRLSAPKACQALIYNVGADGSTSRVSWAIQTASGLLFNAHALDSITGSLMFAVGAQTYTVSGQQMTTIIRSPSDMIYDAALLPNVCLPGLKPVEFAENPTLDIASVYSHSGSGVTFATGNFVTPSPIKNTVAYMANTTAGDCGSLVLNQDSHVVGFHCGTVDNVNFGALVTKAIFERTFAGSFKNVSLQVDKISRFRQANPSGNPSGSASSAQRESAVAKASKGGSPSSKRNRRSKRRGNGKSGQNPAAKGASAQGSKRSAADI